ncbi:MAG: DUF1638 domain-containing protein [Planctomycetes bacterium]|nr:DUF1638 domain-containing protein [Planctomycetota bacterium]
MRRKLIGCAVLREEAEAILAAGGAAATVDRDWLPMALHNRPRDLHAAVRDRIAACAGQAYDAILLLFGLCSRAAHGLAPPPDSRLVIPRVHDCIALHLGSARRHRDQLAAHPGTYWFSRGYLAHRDRVAPGFGAAVEDDAPGNADQLRRQLAERHGEVEAAYLMEVLTESWKENYARAVYLESPANPDAAAERQYVAQYAARNGWRFERQRLDTRLVAMLLGGEWPEAEFAVVQPGQRLEASDNDNALRVVVADGGAG